MNAFLLAALCLLVQPSSSPPAPAVHVEGYGFELGVLKNGSKAFMNRKYVWERVPKAISGWKFTRVNGGMQATITATPAADGRLYIACSPIVANLQHWRLEPQWRIQYTDSTHTIVRIFSLPCKAGVPVRIPKGGWTGCIVLAPQMTAKIVPPAEPDFSRVPGVVIDHSPARTSDYIGCPTIAILPSGRYVAAHSFFGHGMKHGRTRVFLSRDRGRTWRRVAELRNQHFSTLFVHRGALYLMGVGGYHGQITIRRSTDEGVTWTQPRDAHTGLLTPHGGYHTAPTPVVLHAGRLWRAYEDGRGPGKGWPAKFRAFVVSAPENANLLEASSWTRTNAVATKRSWLDRECGGWLEGNAVVAPDGSIVNILRVHCYVGGKAAIVRISADGKRASFDPKTGFVDLPGGAKKFTIRFDPKSKLYWSLTNPVNEDVRNGLSAASVRNWLALVSSPDLRHWTIRRKVLYHPDPLFHAFQYVDWQFDGDDIVAVSRTAYDDGLDGPHNYHDANFFTFHRVKNFRRP